MLKKMVVLRVKGNTDAWSEEINDSWEPENDRERELYKYSCRGTGVYRNIKNEKSVFFINRLINPGRS